MTANLTITASGQTTQMVVSKGSNLLQALKGTPHVIVHACNGKGTCGKCRVVVSGENLPVVSEKERLLLGGQALASGIRLACLVQVVGDLEVRLLNQAREAKIAISDAISPVGPFDPIFQRHLLSISAPSLDDQRSFEQRLIDTGIVIRDDQRLAILKTLPSLIAQVMEANVSPSSDLTLRADTFMGQIQSITCVSSGDAARQLPQLGIAIDIGTTTLAGYLMDLDNDRILATATRLNHQQRHGADVISRIQYCMENSDGLDELQHLITADLQSMIQELLDKAAQNALSVAGVVCTGNTTMLHLLAGLNPASMASSPFIPVTTSLLSIPASELGLNLSQGASVLLLPGLSAYVGADTLSAAVATRMHKSRKHHLLVDLGTNGEILLGNHHKLYGCSTAAGPAFEGAGIRHGMGAVGGAIDKVQLAAGDLSISTIGDLQAAGICGTGLVDAIALLLETGLVDETGRLCFPDELPVGLSEQIISRVTLQDGKPVFVLVPGSLAADGIDIVLTQRDIREFQNAKAAVCAGIRVLIQQSGIAAQDIDSVYLAGGFGNYMNPESALKTGIIPIAFTGKIKPVGNAAGLGALMCLRSKSALQAQKALSKRVQYVELSSSKLFNDAYVEAMLFE